MVLTCEKNVDRLLMMEEKLSEVVKSDSAAEKLNELLLNKNSIT